MARLLAALLSTTLVAGQQPAAPATPAPTSPVRKVVTLIEEMKEQVEKEAEQDQDGHDKYMCWCETTEKEKTEAIENAETRVEELEAFLEQAAAKTSELTETIEVIEGDIAKDKEALATATELRKKASEEFSAEEADMKESLGLLEQAVEKLSKAQLLQQPQAKADAEEALVQVSSKVSRRPKANFQSVVQRDLFDVLGSLDEELGASGSSTGAFLRKRKAVAALQTEAGQPGDLQGAAAGAKSYNSRSGRIFGILQEMKDEMSRDLQESQKADFMAEKDFQNLRASKTEEIAIASEQLSRKQEELANLERKVAQSKEDLEATKAAAEADKKFLENLKVTCATEETDYAERSKVRGEEIIALSETLKILTEDEARDTFGKTMSFVQLASSRTSSGASASARVMAQDRAAHKAMKRLAKAAHKSGNWALASLAVRVRLDSFTEVKAAMDKMHAELTTQQKEEYAKREYCNKEIDKTEDEVKEETLTKEDLAEKHLQLSNTLETLRSDIEQLKVEEEKLQVSLKQAGEQRKAENQLFQTSVADQRIAVNILNKALARLKAFYQQKALLQVSSEGSVPGQASAPPPPKPKSYSKSAGAGGVLQLIDMVIKDAELEEQKLEQGEQHAQKDYAELVRDATASIEAARNAAEEKAAQVAEAEAGLSDTEQAQLANDQQLDKLKQLLQAHHVDCDWLLKYFDTRQQARQEEMDSITDAKAILSGAIFGK